MPSTAVAVHVELPPLDALAQVGDAELLELVRRWSEARRSIDAGLALLAGQVAERSRPDTAGIGLAQRSGDRTPEALIARITGTTGGEASALVSVGRMLDEAPPWLTGVTSRVDDRAISVPAADAIRRGLGQPNADVAADDLTDAALTLADEAPGLTAEQLARRARELRDDLDAAGVADREQRLRERRSLRMLPQSDGMTRLVALLDPESAAIVSDAIDLVTAPRRGGPRFVDAAAAARAQRVVEDERSTEQLALDALVGLIRIAGRADDGEIYATHAPSVRVHVSIRDLERGTGAAWFEGQQTTVSTATASRIVCSEGWLPVLFDDDGEVLRLGRSQRRFTAKQRTALGARWGGCGVDQCDRPPSWCEAHHLDEWDLDEGATDVDRGILLCAHHHMLIHNSGFRIVRRDDGGHVIVRRGDHDTDPGADADRSGALPGDAPAVGLRVRGKNPIRERRRREDAVERERGGP